MSVTVGVLAAGRSSRFGSNKLWASFEGVPVWLRTVHTFLECRLVDRIVLVAQPADIPRMQKALPKQVLLVAGGNTRQRSLENALLAAELRDGDAYVDHNGASPFVTQREIQEVVEGALEFGASSVAHNPVETPFLADYDGFGATMQKSSIHLLETPQCSVAKPILQAIREGQVKSDIISTVAGLTRVAIVRASERNRKLTYQHDLKKLPIGYYAEDIHKFSSEGELVLAGIRIAGLPALSANSDGDVIFHAIGKSLAQACGRSFSDHADALCLQGQKDSRAYLVDFVENAEVVAVSLHIEARRPRISPLPIAVSVADALKIDVNRVSVDATTGDSATLCGIGEGIRCCCLLTAMKQG